MIQRAILANGIDTTGLFVNPAGKYMMALSGY
jgi:hypothetical protein